MSDLFSDLPRSSDESPEIGDGAVLLRGFAESKAGALSRALQIVLDSAPWRHMVTPSGHRMSVAMTNCGSAGWVSDERGYRYQPVDPLSGSPWPVMPGCFLALAESAAARFGFEHFCPDVCLVNRYERGSRLTLHRDRDERDFTQPIVSVSLGLPATFLFGGLTRKSLIRRIRLENGDVVVWGGPSRLAYHGVATLASGEHPLTGPYRINLTFRKAL